MTASARVRVVSCYKGMNIYQLISKLEGDGNCKGALGLEYITEEASLSTEHPSVMENVDQPKQTRSGLRRMSLT